MLSFPLTVPQRRVAGAALACLVLAVVVIRQQGGGGSPPLRVAPLAPAAPARSSVGGRAIVVDVVGAVAHPGLYHLPQRSRVADAVARAGGLTRRAERAAVNLAAPIADGQQILVAARGSPPGAAGAVGAPRPPTPSRSAPRPPSSSTRCRASAPSPRRRSSPTGKSTGRSPRSRLSMRSRGSAPPAWPI